MISEHAIIHPTAKLADGVSVGPGTIIGADVDIGEGTWVGPHVVIQGPTSIGKNNKIFQFSSIGDAPQAKNYQDEPTRLDIGDENVIREFATISRGTVKGGGITRIGNQNFLMAYSHVGHDCHVGNQVVLVSYAALSGHVVIEDFANIGGYSAIHQFCHIGAYAFISRANYVTKDVLPYLMVGHETNSCGINSVRRAYKIIFRKGLTVQQAVAELEVMQQEYPEVIRLIDALNRATRGILR